MVEDFRGTQKCHANLRLLNLVMINDACVGDGSPLNSFKLMLNDTQRNQNK